MITIRLLDRVTKQEIEEKVYGATSLRLLYSFRLFPHLAKWPFLSQLYGWIQKRRFSRRKIRPFIATYHIDDSEFLKPIDTFISFNDFFIRHLKPSARPLAPGQDVAILPADARYLVYPNITEADGIVVKGKKFSLDTLLQDPDLASRYTHGTLVIARLAPVDCHRFHFPCSGIPGPTRLINGPLYSVNPLALRWNVKILAQNKRTLTQIKTKSFGALLFIEVGATHVGTIVQTYHPNAPVAKGEEKGYFSFGGSTILLLFEPGHIALDQDLLDASRRHLEVRGLIGQSLGRALSPL